MIIIIIMIIPIGLNAVTITTTANNNTIKNDLILSMWLLLMITITSMHAFIDAMNDLDQQPCQWPKG